MWSGSHVSRIISGCQRMRRKSSVFITFQYYTNDSAATWERCFRGKFKQWRSKSAFACAQPNQSMKLCILAYPNEPSECASIWIFTERPCPKIRFLKLQLRCSNWIRFMRPVWSEFSLIAYDGLSIKKTRLFKYIDNFTSKNWKFSDKFFLYFCSKHRLWVLVRTASARAVLTSTHNLCFEQK